LNGQARHHPIVSGGTTVALLGPQASHTARAMQGAVRGAVVAACVGLLAIGAPAHANGAPAKVHALYDVTFNGIKIGSFDFTSTSDGRTYRLSGQGKISVLFGAFKWAGSASAAGLLADLDPKPQTYNFELKGTTRSGTSMLAFDEQRVVTSKVEPPPKIKPDTVKVEPKHLVGVLDPMAAVLALTRSGPDPCRRRVAVFDGSTRVDIVLSPLKQVINASLGPGAATPVSGGIVCAIKPALIAGHRPSESEKYMTKDKTIEIVLRPVSAAGGVYVPLEFVAPSTLGLVRSVATKVTLTMPGGAVTVVKP
jgi:hypothetical protein